MFVQAPIPRGNAVLWENMVLCFLLVFFFFNIELTQNESSHQSIREIQIARVLH